MQIYEEIDGWYHTHFGVGPVPYNHTNINLQWSTERLKEEAKETGVCVQRWSTKNRFDLI